jgi:hypothetical protein
MGKAIQTLGRLLGVEPDNTQVIGTLASYERQIGRWRRADRLFRAGLAIQPDNPGLATEREELWKQQADRVHIGPEWKIVGKDWNERMLRYGAQALITPSVRLGVSFDRNYLDMGAVRRTDGSITPFHGVRQRGELFVEQNWENGQRLRGSMYGSPSGARAGAGAEYARVDPSGQTSAAVEYGKPFWEFQEGAVGGGTRDRLELQRQQRLGARSASWVTGSANRYGLEGKRNAVATMGVSAGVIYRPLPASHAVVLQYGVDAEYRRSIAARADAAGEKYYPLPFYSREIHQASVIGKKAVGRNLRLEGATGMAWDRLGGNGPFLSGRVQYERPKGFSAEIWFDRRLNTVDTLHGKVNRAGATLSWRF